MKGKKIYDALTEIDEKYIDEARTTQIKKQSKPWKRWATIAASIALIFGISIAIIQDKLPIGGKSGTGGTVNTEENIFMSYSGPVFPLTLSSEDNQILATRNIAYDFSLKNEDSLRIWGANVKDNYILSNSSTEDKTVSLIYPFAGSFNRLQQELPIVTVDGQEISSSLYTGGYSEEHIGDGNLNSWQGYKSLLIDGSYEENAFSPYPNLSQKVIVYNFTDFKSPKDYNAATQAISFTIDPSKTTILQYGFDGSETNDDGFTQYSYFVPDESDVNNKKMLIVIGDDITDYTLQGYKTGACEKGNELDNVSVTVTSEEKILSQVLEEAIENFFHRYDHGNMLTVSKEMYLGAVSESMVHYGLLTEPASFPFQYGMLNDVILEAKDLKRVFYLEFQVDILAGSSISVTAHMHKDPSHDFAGTRSKNKDIQGYDMVTQLGTNLQFDQLTAELISTDRIEIVRQNYGFNLTEGISKVKLDPMVEHYYLEISPVEQ